MQLGLLQTMQRNTKANGHFKYEDVKFAVSIDTIVGMANWALTIAQDHALPSKVPT